MEYKWISSENNKDLIIFFNGWGMDENVIKHLAPNKRDVLMFYDYNSLETDFDFSLLDNYENKFLIAWSMGVMVATLFDFITYKSSTAINGTLFPINDVYGIPERIYELTIRNFSEVGAKKFIKNMFSNDEHLLECHRKIENLKSELIALKKYIANQGFTYTKVLISDCDKIIPTKNQVIYWKKDSNISGGHCPFFNYSRWDEFL